MRRLLVAILLFFYCTITAIPYWPGASMIPGTYGVQARFGECSWTSKGAWEGGGSFVFAGRRQRQIAYIARS